MIVLLIGIKGSGKDTVFRKLEEQGFDVENIKIASKIKQMMALALGIPVSGFDLPEVKNSRGAWGKTSIRDLLKGIGEMFRKYHPDIWAYHATIDIIDVVHTSPATHCVVTDLRRINEYELIYREFISNHRILVVDVVRDDIYKREKRIIKAIGVNLFSRAIIWLVNRPLAHISEWEYWKLKKHAGLTITSQDVTPLTKIIEEENAKLFD